VEHSSIEDACGLGEGTERDASDTEKSLDFFQFAGLLEGAEAGNDAVEEVDQEQADVLVAEEVAIAGPVAFGGDGPEPREKGRDVGEILQALKLVWCNRTSRSSGHSQAPLPPTGRRETDQSPLRMRMESRKRKTN
jgi:hypothetical protein